MYNTKFLIKEQVMHVRETVKILIEKRFRVVGLPNFITIRSKEAFAVIPELLQKDAEIVIGEESKTLARVDLIKVIVHYLGTEYDAIVVENVICESTPVAYKKARECNKDKWSIIYDEGTKSWGKETPAD